MAQFMMKQHTAHADAVMCAPAACSARMEAASASETLSMDTAMCAVSFFVVLDQKVRSGSAFCRAAFLNGKQPGDRLR